MTLRVGTFNLFQFVEPPYSWYIKKDKFKEHEFEEKKTWIKKQLEQMNCDIIGFQEVFSTSALQKLVKEHGFKYFKTVDLAKTDERNKNIYISTTVALASKYPIEDVHEVKLHVPALKKHHFEGHFKFARKPICATITLPNEEKLRMYVCHLKSNRLNEFEYIFSAQDSFEHKLQSVQKALKENYSPALKQRLCEATSLYYDIKQSSIPSILVCDLNDKEYSLSIDAMTQQRYHKQGKEKTLLYDAYYLYDKKVYNPHPEAKPPKRTATSYYQSYGNVIDYIFVSKHFNAHKHKQALAKVTSYEVFDSHLQENQNGSLLQSDHAPVVCELEFLEKN